MTAAASGQVIATTPSPRPGGSAWGHHSFLPSGAAGVGWGVRKIGADGGAESARTWIGGVPVHRVPLRYPYRRVKHRLLRLETRPFLSHHVQTHRAGQSTPRD